MSKAKKTSKSALGGRLSDMDLRLLRVFREVVRAGGLAAAEVALNISRSTISVHLSDLESRLGMPLCLRSRGRADFKLTPEGEAVYRAIIELDSHLDAFRSQVNAIQSSLTGSLRIVLPDDVLEIPQLDLPATLARIRQQAPELQLDLQLADPQELELEILAGRADVGINPLHSHRPGLQYRPLFHHQSLLYCSQQHPLAAAEEVSEESLTKQELAAPSHAVLSGAAHLYRLFPRKSTANHMAARLAMILSGQFVGFLPEYLAEDYVQRGQLMALRPERFRYRIENAATFKRSAAEHPAVRLFLESLEINK
ncbi:LysR family transcriptional regulator [Microbulbifer thermotolerans]|uniref:LysR family transcriptional regulator n=1 Tax=Microbulbifer thermotolerans TaxID=252514 RepID=A0A143HQ37_MICTH|nr:LysR family transcriptional regulator [Microbulbifer thermotolerans]AMX03607.1 LysR family transcriptional regulator [Microbulbifer thermotolerans]MCX2781029.1 LysR family transcriptional regulator [Microbulbifer thermotolerans]MCX2782132.1 LysR family transcriptional regulator [Microbulbifer thermotolerans]MCX2796066.1 LysR family transcriptional regulator [Microbulbifer thermotolerans]MCX2801208.1 LysR family transcriptional regulator [Microbulbifer thermotolerans]